MITGLLFVGVACGRFLLAPIPKENFINLRFINDVLALIAFAASAELYLKDMRRQIDSIKWMTFGQLFVTFVLNRLAVFFLANTFRL